jgi:chemotaxis regulatin CheY-phosphate phosphatase CheZ
MKKLFFTVVVVVLFSSPSLFAQNDASEAANKKAEAVWHNIDDYTDVKTLDSFIAKYPDTAWARVAFAIRYSLVAKNPSIQDYNAFLAKYPDRLQSQFAIHEVFKLYRDQDRVNTYLEFITKYPHAAEHTLVAKMRMQTLMFEFVSMIDNLEDYEAFIAAFPDAPQIPAVVKLASKKALEFEQKIFAENAKETDPDDKHKKRGNAITAKWESWNAEYYSKYSQTDLLEKNKGTPDGNGVLLAFKIRWQEKVIAEVYDEYGLVKRLREETRHGELLKKLDAIDKTLQANHKELVQTIREESEKTRNVLRQEFAKLGDTIKTGFDKLEGSLEALHSELVEVNNNLVKIHTDLKDIKELIRETNNSLARLDQQLENVNKNLVEIYNGINENFSQLNANIDRNFKQMGDKIEDVGRKVEEGFERSYKMQIKQLEATVHISGQLENLTTITEHGFGQVIENQIVQQNLSRETLNEVRKVNHGIAKLEQGQERQIAIANATLHVTNDIARTQVRTLNEIQGMRDDVNSGFNNVGQELRGIRSDMNRGFNTVNNTMKAGFEKIDRSIWQSSDRIIQSNQQMQRNIQQQIAASKQTSSSGSSSRSILGKILGGAAGVVATVYGGPVAGAAAASLVNKVVGSGGNVRGQDIVKDIAVDYVSSKNPVVGGILRDVTEKKDGKTVLTNAARTAIEEKYPGATKAVEAVFETIKIERKNSLLSAAAIVARDKGGLSEEEIRLILNCRDAEGLEKVIIAIAKRLNINKDIIMYAADHI